MPKILLVLLCLSFTVRADDLGTMITKTLKTHPDILVEKSRLDIAKTQLDLAGEQFLPTFSVSFENVAATRDLDTNYSNSQAVATFRLQQPLYTFGRLTHAKNKFAAGYESQNLTINEVQVQLAQAVLQAWGEWFVATLRSEALVKSIETHKKLKQSVTRRSDMGASSPSEVKLSLARLAQVEAQAANAELQIRAAKVTLEQLVGEPIPKTVSPRQFLVFEPTSEALMIQDALAVNPTLQRFAADIKQSEYESLEEISALGPEIYLRAEHQRGDFATSIPFQNRVFIGFQSDFGAGASALMEVKLAQQRIQTLKAEVNVVKRDITERVRLELTQLEILDIRQTALELSLSANQDIAEAFNRQYLAGRRSWVEVMNTARELAQAELELADLKAAKVLSYWRLSILVNGLEGTLALNQVVDMK
jgi:adhesin transport system outer membrane protein